LFAEFFWGFWVFLGSIQAAPSYASFKISLTYAPLHHLGHPAGYLDYPSMRSGCNACYGASPTVHAISPPIPPPPQSSSWSRCSYQFPVTPQASPCCHSLHELKLLQRGSLFHNFTKGCRDSLVDPNLQETATPSKGEKQEQGGNLAATANKSKNGC
jgi:hypothetical protein